MSYATIEVDFEVWRELTARRANEDVSYNDVLRQLLDLDSFLPEAATFTDGIPWTVQNITFPSGTSFRARYKGEDYYAEVQEGALLYKGKRYSSPSAAAMAITEVPISGWRFWECRWPDAKEWIPLQKLKKRGWSKAGE